MKVKIKVRTAVAAIIGLAMIGVFHSALRAQETSPPPHSVWGGAYTAEQAKRGEALHAQECARCHGADLLGVGEAPPLSGGAFLSNWDGLTVGDLSDRIRISMPPNNKGKLSRQQIIDILSHVLNVNSFPAGKTELQPKTESLKQIRIEATKPKDSSGSKHGEVENRSVSRSPWSRDLQPTTDY
jgi:S-disulfanyl-L-cysteine oxidoreductase SoxD